MFKIQLQQCGKSFNRKWLYRDTDLLMQSGEKWALLGPNGSGKSTFCLMLAAQVYPTKGSILWSLDEAGIDPQFVYRHVALASPAMELPAEHTVKGIVDFQRRMKPFRMKDPLQELAACCGFDESTMNNPIQNFSSGMKQRVKLCLAAFSDTPLLILDEPLSNLDAAGIALYEFLLRDFTKDRLLVIASNRAEEYVSCDHRFSLGSMAKV